VSGLSCPSRGGSWKSRRDKLAVGTAQRAACAIGGPDEAAGAGAPRGVRRGTDPTRLLSRRRGAPAATQPAERASAPGHGRTARPLFLHSSQRHEQSSRGRDALRGPDGSPGTDQLTQLGAHRRHRRDGLPVGMPPQPSGQEQQAAQGNGVTGAGRGERRVGGVPNGLRLHSFELRVTSDTPETVVGPAGAPTTARWSTPVPRPVPQPSRKAARARRWAASRTRTSRRRRRRRGEVLNHDDLPRGGDEVPVVDDVGGHQLGIFFVRVFG
jgi:hypothetical protein